MAMPRLFGGNGSWTLDAIWDKKSNQYYKPVFSPEFMKLYEDERMLFDAISPGQHSLQKDSHKLVAFIDTGIHSMHPWLSDTIDGTKDFTGEGIEDRLGH